MQKYLHEEDIEIIHNFEDSGDTVLIDCEGCVYFEVKDNTWTDEQILKMVRFANNAYNYGYNAGKKDNQFEIKKVLGI